MKMLSFAIPMLLALAAGSTAAQPPIPSDVVQIPKGANSATIKGQLKGPSNDVHDYLLRAKAGQTMTVSLQTNSISTSFNVMPPDSQGEAIFQGELEGKKQWSASLPEDGEYRVRVYLNRAAARQGKAASFTLTIGVSDGGG